MTPPQNPKRVLYLITKAANFGGAQRYVFDLATASNRAGHVVAVAVGSEGLLSDKLRAAGISVLPVDGLQRDVGIAKELRALKSLTTLMREWKPDVVHISSSKAGLLGSLAARRAGVKRIIFTAHGWPFFEERSFLWKLMAWKMSYWTTLLSHTVICVSEYDRTHARFPFLSHKLKRVYNGVVSPELFNRTEARAALIPSEVRTDHANDLWLVAIGELHPNKNLDSLVYALSALKRTDPQMRLFLTLIGDGELRASLKARVAERGLSELVHFTGHVDDPYRYLSAFDVLVMPSKKEGLPYTLLFGLSVGIPIIASKVGGIPEILTNAATGRLTDPRRIATLLDALRSMYYEHRHDTAWHTPHELGEFSLSRMVERTLALYESKNR